MAENREMYCCKKSLSTTMVRKWLNFYILNFFFVGIRRVDDRVRKVDIFVIDIDT
jgi:hypothetical protein